MGAHICLFIVPERHGWSTFTRPKLRCTFRPRASFLAARFIGRRQPRHTSNVLFKPARRAGNCRRRLCALSWRGLLCGLFLVDNQDRIVCEGTSFSPLKVERTIGAFQRSPVIWLHNTGEPHALCLCVQWHDNFSSRNTADHKYVLV